MKIKVSSGVQSRQSEGKRSFRSRVRVLNHLDERMLMHHAHFDSFNLR